MITDLSSYNISDFILFSGEALSATIRDYNRAIWPSQIFILLLSLVLVFILAGKKTSGRIRLQSLLMMAAWIWVGFVYHREYFEPINWAARYFSWLFFLEAALIFLFGVVLARPKPGESRGMRRLIGTFLFTMSAFIPINWVRGDSLDGILLFGWGPDATAIGTIGILLLCKNSLSKFLLMLPPVLWCLISTFIQYGLSASR